MAKVVQKYDERYGYETVDHMIRRFRKKVDRDGILYDMRKHEFYLSPSEKKRKKKEDARREREYLARKAERKRLARLKQLNSQEKPLD